MIYRIHKTEYLDEEGLNLLWDKIKKYVEEHSAEIDLTEYITQEQLEEALANIDTSDIDLSAYATKEELSDALLGYAKADHTHTDYATTEYVNTKITEVEGNPGVYIGADEPTEAGYSVWIDTDDGECAELDNYYTKEEVNALIDAKLGVIENGTY